jgi:hypothetical protein
MKEEGRKEFKEGGNKRRRKEGFKERRKDLRRSGGISVILNASHRGHFLLDSEERGGGVDLGSIYT